jgi:hypothetical protein
VTALSRQVRVTFLLAFSGVLGLIGLILNAFLGPVALVAYVGLLAAPVLTAAVLARSRRARLTTGRTCTCCSGTVHDAVQVI